MITCARISETCGDNVVRIEARASGVAPYIFCKASTVTGELFDFEALPTDDRHDLIVDDLAASAFVRGAIDYAVARGL
jgi:hypothetical protein